jgi:hypothetical protein
MDALANSSMPPLYSMSNLFEHNIALFVLCCLTWEPITTASSLFNEFCFNFDKTGLDQCQCFGIYKELEPY